MNSMMEIVDQGTNYEEDFERCWYENDIWNEIDVWTKIDISNVFKDFDISNKSDLNIFKDSQKVQIACTKLNLSSSKIFLTLLQSVGIEVRNDHLVKVVDNGCSSISAEMTMSNPCYSDSLHDGYSNHSPCSSSDDLILKSYSIVKETQLDRIIPEEYYLHKMKWVIIGEDIRKNLVEDIKNLNEHNFFLHHPDTVIDPNAMYGPVGPIVACLKKSKRRKLLFVKDDNDNDNNNVRGDIPTIEKRFLNTNTITKTKKEKIGILFLDSKGKKCYCGNIRVILEMIEAGVSSNSNCAVNTPTSVPSTDMLTLSKSSEKRRSKPKSSKRGKPKISLNDYNYSSQLTLDTASGYDISSSDDSSLVGFTFKNPHQPAECSHFDQRASKKTRSNDNIINYSSSESVMNLAQHFGAALSQFLNTNVSQSDREISNQMKEKVDNFLVHFKGNRNQDQDQDQNSSSLDWTTDDYTSEFEGGWD